MENIDKAFTEKFRLNELTLETAGSWIISLRPQQPTIGSLVLTLNRKCETLSQMSEEEGKELSFAFRKIENILNLTFKPDKINYLALMMVDNQVHFHVLPRYGRKVLFENTEYTDNQWPGPPSLNAIDLSSIQLMKLLDLLRRKK